MPNCHFWLTVTEKGFGAVSDLPMRKFITLIEFGDREMQMMQYMKSMTAAIFIGCLVCLKMLTKFIGRFPLKYVSIR